MSLLCQEVSTIFNRFMSDYGLKKKMIIFMICIVFVPIFLFNSVLAYVYMSFYNGKVDEGYKSFQKESYSNLNYKLDLYQTMIDRTVYSKDVTRAIENIVADRLISVYEASVIVDSEIDNITFGNSMEEVYDFSVYLCDRNTKAVGKYMSSIRNVENESWRSDMEKKWKYIFVENRFGHDFLSIAQNIYPSDEYSGNNEPIAIVKMDINLDVLFSNTIKETDKSIGIKILTDDVVCYEYGNVATQTDVKKLFCIEENLLVDNLKIRYVFDKTEQRGMVYLMMLGFVGVGLAILAVLTMIIIRFSNNISERVGVVLAKIRRIEQEDFDVNVTLKGNDEFADIDRKICKMSKEIERAINEKYIIEAEHKSAELRALQMQINPHFMFNTLETINSFSKRDGCEEIGFISRKMGEVLRYNIDCTNEYVEIHEEFEHIKSYLDIQRIRYSNKFEVFYDISESATGCMVPKFILQPIVENTIKHAIQEGEDTYFISIVADVQDGVLTINISDDGIGISEERLTIIRQNLLRKQSDGKSSIGLKNVHLRLKIKYGDEFGVSITSKKNVGTSVVLRLPAEYLQKGGEKF